MADVIVLGAGMAGLGAALALQARGCDVALVDRRGPGLETSYGNAGIIQSEAVAPYALPRDWATLLRMAFGRSNDVEYTLGGLLRAAGPLFTYWRNSTPARHARATETYAALIGRAEAAHAPLIARSGADNLVTRLGFRELYREARAFDVAAAHAEAVAAEWGLPVAVETAEAVLAAEPVLRSGGAGAVHWTGPWTVSDPGGLAAAYAALFVREGGALVSGDAASLRQAGAGWELDTVDGPLGAARVVVALGPWAPQLMARFGMRIPMLLKRGHHRHYSSPQMPHLPLLDAAHGYVMAPMRQGLRLTTGAQLDGQEAPPSSGQIGRAERAAAELLDLGPAVEAEPWVGARPCMPDMLPVIGEVPGQAGLWCHFGHGHQGFTLGPATGEILAAMMAGEAPGLDTTPLLPARFA